MASNRHDDEGRVCLCDRPDGTCPGRAVRRLSQDRIRELAEEIWTASLGWVPPARPLSDSRTSRAGASAQAAYRRRGGEERQAWRLGWRWRAWAILGASAIGGLLTGSLFGDRPAWLITMLVAALAWWRLRFRPSAGATLWRRQAVMQRRTAGMLEPLAAEGWLILYDLVLSGWLTSLDHVVVGPTGVWVVESWRRSRLLPVGTGRPSMRVQLNRSLTLGSRRSGPAAGGVARPPPPGRHPWDEVTLSTRCLS